VKTHFAILNNDTTKEIEISNILNKTQQYLKTNMREYQYCFQFLNFIDLK